MDVKDRMGMTIMLQEYFITPSKVISSYDIFISVIILYLYREVLVRRESKLRTGILIY